MLEFAGFDLSIKVLAFISCPLCCEFWVFLCGIFFAIRVSIIFHPSLVHRPEIHVWKYEYLLMPRRFGEATFVPLPLLFLELRVHPKYLT